MNILIGTILLWVLAFYLWRRLATPERRGQAIVAMLDTLAATLPRIGVALVGAGFFAELLPRDLIATYIGAEAGLRAVVVAIVLGVLTPGGAFVSFALAAAALEAGASLPAMLAYVTSWALLGFTKVIAEETAIMGPGFALRRAAISVPLPFVVGLIGWMVL